MGNLAIAFFFPIVSPDYLFAEMVNLIVGKTRAAEILDIPDHSPSDHHETSSFVEELQKQMNNLVLSQTLSGDPVEPKLCFHANAASGQKLSILTVVASVIACCKVRRKSN